MKAAEGVERLDFVAYQSVAEMKDVGTRVGYSQIDLAANNVCRGYDPLVTFRRARYRIAIQSNNMTKHWLFLRCKALSI